MQIPKGFEIEEGNTKDFVLKLHRNVYEQKQAGRVWNKYLTDTLLFISVRGSQLIQNNNMGRPSDGSQGI
jgi:hypothetical protein